MNIICLEMMNFKTALLIAVNITPTQLIKSSLLLRIKEEVKYSLYIFHAPGKRIYSKVPGKNAVSSDSENDYSTKYLINDYYKEILSVHLQHLDSRILLSHLRENNQANLLNYDNDKLVINTQKEIDVIYFTDNLTVNDMKSFADKFVSNKSAACKNISSPLPPNIIDCNERSDIDVHRNDSNNSETTLECDESQYDSVVLGGTFDKLHTGHKLLLSHAVLLSSKKVTVGVTHDSMLKSKILREFIDPCETRIKQVKEFLIDVERNIEYDVIPIYDMFGPTTQDPTFKVLVASTETQTGTRIVNEQRIKNGLNSLKIFLIPMIETSNGNCSIEENKVSSTNQRMRMLGSLLIPPEKREIFPGKYVIGLTGGIASGKTSISEHLAKLGAGIISADRIGHRMYDIGQPAYEFIYEKFNRCIVDDKSVDRSELAKIVFNDQDKLKELNDFMWPVILKEIKEQIVNASEHKIIILEAAVLGKAGWKEYCNEIWACIISTVEAVKRLKERNGLNEQEAMKRIILQPSNEEYVKGANVVFCSYWSKQFTQQQVEKAWNHLITRI